MLLQPLAFAMQFCVKAAVVVASVRTAVVSVMVGEAAVFVVGAALPLSRTAFF